MRYLKGALAVALVVLVSGCSLLGSEGSDELTEQLRRAAQEVPSFGGVTIDEESKQITIHLLGSEKKEAARSAVQEIFGPSADEVALHVRPATGNASEDLKSKASGVRSVEGVNVLYYDQTIGYLRVGTTSARAVMPAQKTLKELEVPLDQVVIVVGSEVVKL